jgi:hypothetical protein
LGLPLDACRTSKKEKLKMKKLFALSMLIFSVAPACADDNAVHPMEALEAKQAEKNTDAKDATKWYLHHRRYDPQLENGICVKNCDGVVEVADGVVEVARAVPVPVPVPPPAPASPLPHKIYYGSGITDMLAGAKCITIPASGCDAIWTAKRHAKRVVYRAPICR